MIEMHPLMSSAHLIFQYTCVGAGSSRKQQPLVMSYGALKLVSGLQQLFAFCFLLTSEHAEGAAEFQFCQGAVFARGCKQRAKWVDFLEGFS